MSSEATLLSKIFSITRGDLDSAVFPMPQPARMLAESQLVRITRLARFWGHSEFSPDALIQSTVDLLAGFHAQSSPFLFILRGEARNAECWVAGSKAMFSKDLVSRMARSAYPDCRTDETRDFPFDHFGKLSHAVLLTGTPTLRETAGQKSASDQIERVIRGLQGQQWAFMVSSQPLVSAVVVRTINELGREIRDGRAIYLLKQSPIDEQNRTAQRYIDLLEAKLKRFESGRMQGMWQAQMALFAESSAALALGKGLLHSAYSGERSVPDPIRCSACATSANEPPALEPITTTELAAFVRPPQEEYAGYEVVDYARYGVEVGDRPPAESKALQVGEVIDRGVPTGNSLWLCRSELTKHVLVVGVTGSGKTNSCMYLLDQIWEGGRGVPFLVIESAKSEYRGLLKNPRFRGLRVFTVGDETTSPLRLNPFEVPKGILIQTHVDYVKSLFSAAFVLYPPMPYVLEQSLQAIYEDRGWDLARNVNSRGAESPRAFPTLADLAAKIVEVVDKMGYDQRTTMDVKAGLLARVNQLRLGGGKSLMFGARRSIDSFVLFDAPCLLELKNIVSDDEKAFVIGLVLIRLYEHCEAQRDTPANGLRHVTLIEEAHRLLRNTTTEQGSDIVANPRGRAIEVFANILSEIRALGESFIIAEQIPAKLTPDAIKNTNLKIVHRLVAADDRVLIGGSINLNEAQQKRVGTLSAGEVVAFMEGVSKPALLKVPLLPGRTEQVSDSEVAGAMKAFQKGDSNVNFPYLGCSYCAGREGSACGALLEDIEDWQLQSAFRRFFNSLRFDSNSVMDCYVDLQRIFEAAPRRRKGSFTCAVVQLVEQEVERRGEFYAWRYEQVERAVQAAGRLLRSLAENSQQRDMTRFSAELDEFSRFLASLHRIDTRPFVGCQLCKSPCLYRFDMQHGRDSARAAYFHEGFCNTKVEWAELAKICLGASNDSFTLSTSRPRLEAALCFAAQQFNEMGLSKTQQEQSAARLATFFQE